MAFVPPARHLLRARDLADARYAGSPQGDNAAGPRPSQAALPVMSYDELGSSGVLPFGYMVGGTAMGVLGPSAALLGGVAILLVATAGVLSVPSVRALRPAAAESEDAKVPVSAPAFAGPVKVTPHPPPAGRTSKQMFGGVAPRPWT